MWKPVRIQNATHCTWGLLREVLTRGGVPLYLTLDLGHMSGQRHFQRPTIEQVSGWIDKARAGKACGRTWLGPDMARSLFHETVASGMASHEALKHMQQMWDEYAYLFSCPEDGNVHAWVRRLGMYSPIIHLQQSDGTSSLHWPFSDDYNQSGIIKGAEVLESLAESYRHFPEAGMPPPCNEICLALEPFIGRAGDKEESLLQIAESIRYWRKFVPKDGIKLSEAVAQCKEAQ